MIKPADHFHGSDLEKIEELYNIKKESILPYGANVNPLGISPVLKEHLIKHIDVINEYPDREYLELRRALSGYCDTPIENIVVGGGSTELIRAVIEIVNPKKTLLIEPTYSEYKRDLTINGGEIDNYILDEERDFNLDVDEFITHIDPSIDLLVICNPNNPTSTSISTEDMGKILEACKICDTFVMVDETYIEFVKEVNAVTAVPLAARYSNIAVLRGVSKFFAAPGLRLGYAICSNQDMINKINSSKNPWSINSLASIAGPMFSDETYINLTKALIQTEQSLVYSAMSSRKTIKLYKPTTNFMLIKLLKEDLTAFQVFEYCIRKGIMLRDCSDFTGLGDKYVRFCFLKPEDNDKMVNTILEIV